MPYLPISRQLVCTLGYRGAGGFQVFSSFAGDTGVEGRGKGTLETEKRDGKGPAKHSVNTGNGERHKY